LFILEWDLVSDQKEESDNSIISAEITKNEYQEVETEGKAPFLDVAQQELNIQL